MLYYFIDLKDNLINSHRNKKQTDKCGENLGKTDTKATKDTQTSLSSLASIKQNYSPPVDKSKYNGLQHLMCSYDAETDEDMNSFDEDVISDSDTSEDRDDVSTRYKTSCLKKINSRKQHSSVENRAANVEKYVHLWLQYGSSIVHIVINSNICFPWFYYLQS